MDTGIVPVLLCGGAGRRLWPISRTDLPKQFAPLLSDQSPFEATVMRLLGLETNRRTLCVTTRDYQFLVADKLQGMRYRADILVEPVAKNTAAAICSAAFHIARQDAEAIMVVLPSDHVVEDFALFNEGIMQAVEVAKRAHWVLLGVKPDKPSPEFGYIQPRKEEPASARGGCNSSPVACFVEKPSKEIAAKLIKDGWLWNAGVFIVRVKVALETIRACSPATYEACREAMDNSQHAGVFCELDEMAYQAAPMLQLDKGVLAHLETSRVVEFSGRWDDLGSFEALSAQANCDAHGNSIIGEGLVEGSANLFIHSKGRQTMAIGVSDLLIVNSGDKTLIMPRDKAASAHEFFKTSSLRKQADGDEGKRVNRSWGYYETLDEKQGCKVKRVVVFPGRSLSRQFHYHRAEHWIVISGTASVERDGEQVILGENEDIFIPQKAVHRLANETLELLELIEVQTGHLVSEEDIVRLDDDEGGARGDRSIA